VGNQNKLTNENIAKIFETYKTRAETEKFSHRATIKEIQENDYNLNIPRYVDTFEEEVVVNIEEVAKKLKELNANELVLQKKIGEFCEELKISKPF
jgi:type I restriction enzyme M protein